jgi:hypothetical protein
MSIRTKLTAAGLAVGVLGAVLAGTTSTASASPPSQASSGSDCRIAVPGQPGKTVAIRCPAGHPGAAVTTASANRTLAAAPDATPSDALCRGVAGQSDFGWVGAAPGSSADGGIANDLWWDATQSKSPTQMQIYSGNGGDNQQWCEQYLGSGKFAFFAYYAAYHGPQCLTVENGYGTYVPGMRVYGEDCGSPPAGSPEDQAWYVCLRSGTSFSLEPAGAKPSSVWLDVWGGGSNNGKSAFVQGSPLQIWTGNGQDNQRFTFFPSPGEPGGLPFDYTIGVSGC